MSLEKYFSPDITKKRIEGLQNDFERLALVLQRMNFDSQPTTERVVAAIVTGEVVEQQSLSSKSQPLGVVEKEGEPTNFRVAIKTEMTNRRMMIKDLAKQANCSTKTVSRILNGTNKFPENRILGQIADALGLDVEKLVESVMYERARH